MDSRKASEKAFQLPWWLEGDTTCVFCLQSYAVQVEYYCLDCDRGFCPLCTVTVERDTVCWICPECDASSRA